MMPRIASLCTGYGGLDEAVQRVLGGRLAWVSDIDPGACKIIAHRFPGVPNIGDLTVVNWQYILDTFGRPDVLTGGYPCQPFSIGGRKKGTADERHIWPHIACALRVLRPRIAFFENVRNHLRIGFDTVLADLAALGFDAEWITLHASDVLAPHGRPRLFLLAVAQDTDGEPWVEWRQSASRQEARGRARADAGGRGRAPAADADSVAVRVESVALAGGGGAAVAGQPRPEVYGAFAPAVARWEAATGICAPWPTDDRGRLNPAFVEWMQGVTAGHVTGVPGLTVPEQKRALGNGVVPQQGEAALRVLLDRVEQYTARAAA